MRYLDRSRQVAWERCPRLRYWQYEHEAVGLEPQQTGLALFTGINIHQGMEQLLQGQDLEAVLAAVLPVYAVPEVAESLSFGGYTGEPADIMLEQAALVEALLRAAAFVRIPMKIGELLATEREEAVELTEGLQLLARADAVYRHYDGLAYVHNFKTVSSPDDKWRQQWQMDTATISEVLAVETRLGERLGGVVIEGICKGRKAQHSKSSEYAGRTYHDSPLLWAWMKPGEPPFPDEWTTAYEWTGADGRGHRLGKGWMKQPTYLKYPGGTKAWIEHLWATSPELLGEQFIMLPPILRSDADIEEWKRDSIIREQRIAIAAEAENAMERFPKHSSDGNCIWPQRCPVFELCWGTHSADPEGSGWKQRTPNHPTEVYNDEATV